MEHLFVKALVLLVNDHGLRPQTLLDKRIVGSFALVIVKQFFDFAKVHHKGSAKLFRIDHKHSKWATLLHLKINLIIKLLLKQILLPQVEHILVFVLLLLLTASFLRFFFFLLMLFLLKMVVFESVELNLFFEVSQLIQVVNWLN